MASEDLEQAEIQFLEALEERKKKLLSVKPGSLADRVLSIVWAFPAHDSRREEIRQLAYEIACLEERK